MCYCELLRASPETDLVARLGSRPPPDVSKLSSYGENRFDTIISLTSAPDLHTQALLMEIWRVVKPQGSVRLLEDFQRTFEHSSHLASALTLAGFTHQVNSTHGDVVMVRVNAALQSPSDPFCFRTPSNAPHASLSIPSGELHEAQLHYRCQACD